MKNYEEELKVAAETQQALVLRIVNLKKLLSECIPYIREAIPQSCGKCGTPDASCDGLCMDAAYASELLRKVRAEFDLKEYTLTVHGQEEDTHEHRSIRLRRRSRVST